MKPEPFTILGGEGIEADFMADSTSVKVNSPVHFTDLSLELIESWEWDFDNNGLNDDTNIIQARIMRFAFNRFR